jgi:hypothetical protein
MTTNGKKIPSSVFNFEGLCAEFHLKVDLEKFVENLDCSYTYAVVRKEALATGDDEDEANEKAYEAECAEQGAYCEAYMRAAVQAITDQAEEHFDLYVEPVPYSAKHGKRWRVKPFTSWKHTLNLILDTVNGVGCFYFPSLNALRTDGCDTDTYRTAVLNYMYYLARYGEVYGGKRLQRDFDEYYEIYARNI